MPDPQIATQEEWLAARLDLLQKEKELTKHRDDVNAARRQLPMVEVVKDYLFHGTNGDASLLDLFEGRDQLLVYHFMFDPRWGEDEGCPSCSHTIDNVGHLSHLHARNTTLALVSLAPLEKLQHYKQRMGWEVPWYSSSGTDFNYDFHVTSDASVAPVEYNYKGIDELVRLNPDWEGWTGEQPGISAFLRRGNRVFHTYSGYSRATDMVVNTHNWLDFTARGRQEDWEQPAGRSDGPMMSWLRRHDEYEPDALR